MRATSTRLERGSTPFEFNVNPRILFQIDDRFGSKGSRQPRSNQVITGVRLAAQPDSRRQHRAKRKPPKAVQLEWLSRRRNTALTAIKVNLSSPRFPPENDNRGLKNYDCCAENKKRHRQVHESSPWITVERTAPANLIRCRARMVSQRNCMLRYQRWEANFLGDLEIRPQQTVTKGWSVFELMPADWAYSATMWLSDWIVDSIVRKLLPPAE